MSAPPRTRESVPVSSGDVVAEQIARLRKLFPEIVSESKIDFDKLRATLGAAVEAGPGRFSFSWAGKDDAIALLQTPSRATLVPCPDESVNFETTGNAFIEGDNLEVLKLLFKPYFGRVKLIYIDPPYNTGQDFVYPDNYADPLNTYLQLTGQVDAEGNLLTSNPETSGRYHSAWLSMMYPRLFLARQLLREDEGPGGPGARNRFRHWRSVPDTRPSPDLLTPHLFTRPSCTRPSTEVYQIEADFKVKLESEFNKMIEQQDQAIHWE